MNAAQMAPVKKAPATYMVEFGICVTLYVFAILGREWLYGQTTNHAARIAIIALPVIPIWLMFFAVVRHYRRIDELAKILLLKNVAIAAGLMSCVVTSYALLEDAGLPKLSITWAWPTLAVCWVVATAVNEWRGQ